MVTVWYFAWRGKLQVLYEDLQVLYGAFVKIHLFTKCIDSPRHLAMQHTVVCLIYPSHLG